MPFKSGNGRDVDKDIVSGLEGEVWGPPDDQADHFGGEDDAHGDPGFALFTETFTESEEFFDEKNNARDDEPFPKVGSVQDQQYPIRNVKQMRPVKDLQIKMISRKI